MATETAAVEPRPMVRPLVHSIGKTDQVGVKDQMRKEATLNMGFFMCKFELANWEGFFKKELIGTSYSVLFLLDLSETLSFT